jgi:hypothetical protein
MVSTSQSLLKVTLPLTGRANKPITTAELIKRLTELSDQLIDASQDNPAIKSQLEKNIVSQLADKSMLQHKDKGVKSYVAVCIVEALRICAPDAPFNASQLKVWSHLHGSVKYRKYSNYSLSSSNFSNQVRRPITLIPFTS